MKKIKYDDIIDVFLTACAESEGLTEPVEIEEYIKNRKEDIQALMIKKGVK